MTTMSSGPVNLAPFEPREPCKWCRRSGNQRCGLIRPAQSSGCRAMSDLATRMLDYAHMIGTVSTVNVETFQADAREVLYLASMPTSQIRSSVPTDAVVVVIRAVQIFRPGDDGSVPENPPWKLAGDPRFYTFNGTEARAIDPENVAALWAFLARNPDVPDWSENPLRTILGTSKGEPGET